MMTSSNGNIFRVTGPLCGEFTGPGELPTRRPVTRSFDVFFDLRLNKRLSKQPWGWWFETLSCPLWRHGNGKYGICEQILYRKPCKHTIPQAERRCSHLWIIKITHVTTYVLHMRRCMCQVRGPSLNIKIMFTGIRIHSLKIRRSWDLQLGLST